MMTLSGDNQREERSPVDGSHGRGQCAALLSKKERTVQDVTETINLLLTAVGSVGFPIVIALLAAWYIKYLGDKNSETVANMQAQIMEMSNKQNEQLDKMSDALTEVQKSLAALASVIREGVNDGK